MSIEREIERLVVRLMGDGASYEKMMDEAIASSSQFSKAQEQLESSQKLANQTTQVGTARLKEYGSELQSVGMQLTLVGGVATAAFGGMAAAALSSAGKFEQTNIAFETMLGSASQTKTLLADLTDFAAKTPFEMPEIEQAARGLVQFGERGDELMATLKNIGNAAAGTSTQFGMVALIYNQIRGVGKLLTQDFRQLSTRGILSLDDLAKHFGVTLEEANKMLSEGRITFNDVKEIFAELSAEGGRFADLMERQSESMLGKVSTLKDNINIGLRQIGESMMGIAKPIVDVLVKITDWFQSAPQWVKTGAAAFIGLGAVIGTLVTSVGGLLLTVGTITTAFAGLGGASAILTAGIATLKTTMISMTVGMNPWILGILAAAAAFATLKSMIDEANASARESARVAGEMGNERSQKILSMEPGQKRDSAIQQEIARRRGDVDAIIKELIAIENKSIKISGRVIGIDSITGQYGELKDELAQAKKELEGFIQASQKSLIVTEDGKAVNAEALEDMDKLIAKLKEEKMLHGLTGNAREIALLKSKGATEAQIREAESLNAVNEAMKKHDEHAKKMADEKKKQAEEFKRTEESAKEFVNSMQAQIAAFGMSSEAARIYKMQLDGVDESIISAAENNLKILDAKRAEKKLTEELTRKSEELNKKHRSPVEKFEEELRLLKDLLNRDLITKEIFDKAEKEAKKTFAEDMKLTVKISAKWDATSADSAEAFSRLNDFRRMLDGQRDIRLPGSVPNKELQAAIPDFFKVQKKPGEFDYKEPKAKESSIAGDEKDKDLASIATGIGQLVALAQQHWTGEVVDIKDASLA